MRYLLFTFLISILFTGCVRIDASFVPPTGIIYTSVKAPLTTRFNNAEYTENKYSEKKLFLQFPYPMFGFFPSIAFNNDNTKIDGQYEVSKKSKIEYADYELVSFLGIFGETSVHYYYK